MTYNDLFLIGIAWRLDRLRWADSHELDGIVRTHGTCMSGCWEDEPAWLDEHMSDRDLAERLCAGCPVQDECLELELRTAGEHTVGVWGGLSEEDRRALHFHWLQRGERAFDPDEGGATR